MGSGYFHEVSKPLKRAYYATFSSPTGRRVLQHILEYTGFFDVTPADPAHLLLLDFGKQILKNCGVWRENAIPLVLGSLFHEPPPELKEEESDAQHERGSDGSGSG